MAFHSLRGGGYLLLAVAGWAAGRWVWPGDRGVEVREPGKVVGPGAGAVRSPAGPGHRVPPANTAGLKTVDGKAAGREMRASGSDAGFRDRARQMALEPPPALTDFLAAVTDSEVLRATLLEDAVVWAFCRKPEQGLLLLSSLAGREEIGALTEKALRFFPPKNLPVVLAWYQRLPEEGLKAEARQELVRVLVYRDFRQAVALVAGMSHGTENELEERQDELIGIYRSLTPDQRRELMRQPGPGLLPEDAPFLVKLARQHETNVLQQYDREAFMKKLAAGEAFLSPPSVGEYFVGWVQSDPIRAARALEQLPAETEIPEVYLQFAATWAKGNVGMASQWVKDLPEGETKQEAVRGLVGGLMAEYPVEAAIWAGTLTDSRTRFLELQRLLAITSGPAAAGLKTAVNGMNLTPGERAELNLPTPP